MRDYARLCEIMRDYANQRKYMLASQAFARHLFVRGMRARMQKRMRRRLWFSGCVMSV